MLGTSCGCGSTRLRRGRSVPRTECTGSGLWGRGGSWLGGRGDSLRGLNSQQIWKNVRKGCKTSVEEETGKQVRSRAVWNSRKHTPETGRENNKSGEQTSFKEFLQYLIYLFVQGFRNRVTKRFPSLERGSLAKVTDRCQKSPSRV